MKGNDIKKRVWKLTDQYGRTHFGRQWGENVTHDARGMGALCSANWIFCYDSPELALLMNPFHAALKRPHIWKADAEGKTRNANGLIRGVKKLTTLREIPLPVITMMQGVEVAVRCAKEVCSEPGWNTWADGWLSGKDRSEASIARAVADAKAALSDHAECYEAIFFASYAALAAQISELFASKACFYADAYADACIIESSNANVVIKAATKASKASSLVAAYYAAYAVYAAKDAKSTLPLTDIISQAMSMEKQP